MSVHGRSSPFTHSEIATKRWRVGRTLNRSFAMTRFGPFYLVSRRSRLPRGICQLSARQRDRTRLAHFAWTLCMYHRPSARPPCLSTLPLNTREQASPCRSFSFFCFREDQLLLLDFDTLIRFGPELRALKLRVVGL